MLISGIQKFTTLDYPGKTSCILFTPGCNFRCGYCHNPEFVLPEKIKALKESFIPEKAFFNFLNKRRDLLDAVVISGGEPTIHGDLENFVRKIKDLGYLVKIDSNGNRSEVLKKLHKEKLVDFLAMDIKMDLEHYKALSGERVRPHNIQESVEFIKSCGLPYEFRSTLVKELHTVDILHKMAKLITGADKLFLQAFRPGYTLKKTYSDYQSLTRQEMEHIADTIFRPHIKHVEIRE